MSVDAKAAGVGLIWFVFFLTLKKTLNSLAFVRYLLSFVRSKWNRRMRSVWWRKGRRV